MEEIRLYLNEQLADLPDNAGTALRLRKAGTDASDLEQRSGEVSYTLTLPFTRPNDRIHHGRRDVQTARKFNRPAITARLVVGEQVLLRGSWVLSSLKGGYVGKLVSGEVDVFTAIGTKTLPELRFAPFAYQGQHGFAARLAATPRTSDLVFPLVAYGNFFHEPTVTTDDDGNRVEHDVPPSNRLGRGLEVDEWVPSVSFGRTLRRIFADVGWQVRGRPLDDVERQQWILPYTGSGEYPWNWGELLKLSVGSTAAGRYDAGNVARIEHEGTYSHYWTLSPPPDASTHNPARRYRPTEDVFGQRVYQVLIDGGYHVRVDFSATVQDNSGTGLRLQVLRVDAGQDLFAAEEVRGWSLSNGLRSVSWDSRTELPDGVFLQTGQRLVVCVSVHYAVDVPLISRLDYTLRRIEVEPVVADVGPLTLNPAAGLPPMTQRDFVKGFVTLGNLRFSTDAATRTLTFHYRTDYELPPALAEDWSLLTDPADAELVPALTASAVTLAWAEDSADSLLTAGQHDVSFAAGGPDQEQRLLLPWAPTALRTFVGTDGAALQLPCLASADQLKTPLNQLNWSFGYTARVLRYRGLSTARIPVGFTEAGSSRYGLADWVGFSFAGEQGRYARYYRDYLAGLRDGHVLKVPVALSAGRYARLTPASGIRLGGLLYRLGQIQSFTAGGDGVTECELLHVAGQAIGGGLAPTGQPVERLREWHMMEFDPQEWY